MDGTNLIEKVAEEVRQKLGGEGTGHDWWHVYRVWQMAKHLGKEEGADMLIVELAALLHDIADWKFHDGDDAVGPQIAGEILNRYNASEPVITRVKDIILEVSFKGAGVNTAPATIEGKVVQDADRLDALGAVGIARTFAYGGHKNREIYNPEIKPVEHQSFEEYKKNQSHTVNHFYEKLLLLKDRMNTETAKKLAADRHKFMEQYLEHFYKEWEGQI